MVVSVTIFYAIGKDSKLCVRTTRFAQKTVNNMDVFTALVLKLAEVKAVQAK
jgi:hypothetical protein